MRHLCCAGFALAALGAASIANAADDLSIKQGGQMIVAFKDDMATLDPAIGYDWQNWSIIKSLYSRLMDYEPGTTTLRPDLAEVLRCFAGRSDLYLQAPPRREIPQRARADGG